MLIPEEILSKVIENRLSYIRKNPKILDVIFENLSTTNIARVKSYVLGNSRNNISKVRVVRGYPQDAAHLPSYVILLGEEEESDTGLSNYFNFDDDPSFIEPETVTETHKVGSLDGHKYIQLNSSQIIDIDHVTYNGVDYKEGFQLETDSRLLFLNENIIPDMKNYTDMKVTYATRYGGIDLEGSLFESTYQIQVWTNNGDLTIWLYQLLKWMFTIDRNKLVNYGFLTLTFGGGEFEPFDFHESYPNFIYRRAFILKFKYAVVNAIDNGVIKDIDVHPNMINERIDL